MAQTIASLRSLWAKKNSKHRSRKSRNRMLIGVRNVNCMITHILLVHFGYFISKCILIIFRTIPERGNRAELVLTCLHRNGLSMDEFLGQVTLPLNEMDAYERPRARWYKLQSKPGKEKKDKDRGELEVRVAFTVKAGSLTDLSKKEKNKSSTLGLGGSLLSLNAFEKRKSLKKFAKSLGSKMHINSNKKDKAQDNDSISSSISSLSMTGSNRFEDRRFEGSQARGDADPGVISEDDDEFAFDNLSNKSSASSINLKSKGAHLQNTQPAPSPLAIQSYSSFSNMNNFTGDNDSSKPEIIEPKENTESNGTRRQSSEIDEWEAKLYGKHLDPNDSFKRRSWDVSKKSEMEQQIREEIDEPATNINPFEEDNEKPLPRNDFVDDISTKNYEMASTLPLETPIKEKKEKSEKNRFSNKLKYFRKDKQNDILDDSHRKSPSQLRQFSERIIIGHENDILLAHKRVEISPALLKKYEGKSREVSVLHKLYSCLFSFSINYFPLIRK